MSEKITTLTQMEMAAIRGLQAAGAVAQAAADAIEEVLDAVKADKAEAFTYLENQTDPDTLESPGLYSIGANKYLVLRHNDERFSLFQIRITTNNTTPIAFAYRHNDAWSSGYWSDWQELGGVPDGSITAEKLADDAIPAASTSQAGIVQLNNTLTSTSTTEALTAAQGKALNDKAVKYGTCSTAAATAAKTVTISGFSLVSGALAVVRFTSGNTATSPTLNINSTGAKSIYRDGAASYGMALASGEAVLLVYDGTYYRVVDIPDASTSRAGKVQLNDTLTSTGTTQALTAAQGKALNDKIPDIDYQAGSWTPSIKAGTSYTMTGTYTGYYVKVGQLVQIWGYLTPTSTQRATASGHVSLNNLPFSSASSYYNRDVCFDITSPLGSSPTDCSGFCISLSGDSGNFYYRDGKSELRQYTADHVISSTDVCGRIAFYGSYRTTE